MGRVFYTHLARRDRFELWMHIAADNLAAADHLLDEIDETLMRLAGAPDLGRAREDLAPGIRYFPVNRYLIFYSHDSDGITIARVVHGARHLPSLL